MRSLVSFLTFCLFLFLLVLSSYADDRILSGPMSSGSLFTYGNVQTSGETSISQNTSLKLKSLGSTTLNPHFKVSLGGELRISNLEKTPKSDWKLAHFGTIDVDMGDDPDGDGMINKVEFYLGTDPNSADHNWSDSDNDGLADSWEQKTFNTLSYNSTDDPNNDGQTLGNDFQDFLDYLHTNSVLYLEGTLTSKHYRAQEIHSGNTTTIPSGSSVQLTKVNNVKLNPDFSVQAGGALTVYSGYSLPTTIGPPEPPQNVALTYPGNALGLKWSENNELDIAGYKVYKNNILITPTPIENVLFIDADVTHGQQYEYQVTAVDKSGKESVKSNTVSTTADFIIPQLISGYPAGEQLITTNGKPFSILFVVGDQDSEISSIKLYDSTGKDISYRAIIKPNSIELVLINPTSGDHTYTLEVKDQGNNTLMQTVSFTIDALLLETSASIPGGDYSTPQEITLTCSKDATIYYSTDGYPPVIGISSSGQSPITGIQVSSNTSLQFFAVDQAGFKEKTKNEVYIFNESSVAPSSLLATYQAATNSVDLQWQPINGVLISGYQIFRCSNAVDCDILQKSRQANYPPPQQLTISEAIVTPTTFTDLNVIKGATYSYGVYALSTDGTQSVISELLPIQIPATDPALNSSEAITRASAWLESKQDVNGVWQNEEELSILTTSQAINALYSSNQTGATIDKALFFLRGQPADNNDFLSRKIIALKSYGQNTGAAVTRLFSQAKFTDGKVSGWGLTEDYQPDAVDSALAIMACSTSSEPAPLKLLAEELFASQESPFKISGSTALGWVGGAEESIYVTALGNITRKSFMDKPYPPSFAYFDNYWPTGKQASNGSFNDSLVDTASILLWFNPTGPTKDNAISYLVSQQNLNGSWDNDLYLSALCLEALKKGASL